VNSTLPFWDTANAGELCRIPCHPTDENGDITADCFNDGLGRMRADGLVDTASGHRIDPKTTIFVCIEHSGEGHPIFELEADISR